MNYLYQFPLSTAHHVIFLPQSIKSSTAYLLPLSFAFLSPLIPKQCFLPSYTSLCSSFWNPFLFHLTWAMFLCMSGSLFLTVLYKRLSSCSLLGSTCLPLFCTRLKYHSWWQRPTPGLWQKLSLHRGKTEPAAISTLSSAFSLICTHISTNTQTDPNTIFGVYASCMSNLMHTNTQGQQIYPPPRAHNTRRYIHFHTEHNHSVYVKEITR